MKRREFRVNHFAYDHTLVSEDARCYGLDVVGSEGFMGQKLGLVSDTGEEPQPSAGCVAAEGTSTVPGSEPSRKPEPGPQPLSGLWLGRCSFPHTGPYLRPFTSRLSGPLFFINTQY